MTYMEDERKIMKRIVQTYAECCSFISGNQRLYEFLIKSCMYLVDSDQANNYQKNLDLRFKYFDTEDDDEVKQYLYIKDDISGYEIKISNEITVSFHDCEGTQCERIFSFKD